MSRTIVITDVHGCADELDALLDKAAYSISDRVVFLGDAMDRGPKCNEVLNILRNVKADCCMGNHDEKHARYYSHEQKVAKIPGYKNPMTNFAKNEEKFWIYRSLSPENVAFMRSWQPTVKINENTVGVHAGIIPGIPLEHQKYEILLHVRWIDNDKRKMVPLKKDFSQPENTYFWTDRFNEEYNVVFGHSVLDLEKPTINKSARGFLTIGLDTGAVFGGRLTAYIPEQEGFISVPSKQYASRGHNKE